MKSALGTVLKIKNSGAKQNRTLLEARNPRIFFEKRFLKKQNVVSTDLSFVPSQDRTNQPALVCQNNEFGNSFSLYPTTTAEDFSIAIEYARAFGVCWRTSGASLLRVKSAQTFDDDDLANASFSSCLLC